MTPVSIGTIGRMTSTALAEAVFDRMGPGRHYAIAIDWKGIVLLAMPNDFPPGDIIMVCNRGSDPDVLADNIRDVKAERDTEPKPKQRRVLRNRNTA